MDPGAHIKRYKSIIQQATHSVIYTYPVKKYFFSNTRRVSCSRRYCRRINRKNRTVSLTCFEFKSTICNPFLSYSGSHFQYNARGSQLPQFNMEKKVKRTKDTKSGTQVFGSRPKAWRIPFLYESNYGQPNYTVSHLCHNTKCYNWNHHVWELLDVNKGRNGCPGGAYCFHITKCLRPGPFYNK